MSLSSPATEAARTPVALAPALVDEFIAVRHDIHRHPEMAFDEHRTAQLLSLIHI